MTIFISAIPAQSTPLTAAGICVAKTACHKDCAAHCDCKLNVWPWLLIPSVVGNNQINLSCTVPANNGSDIRGYSAERSADGDAACMEIWSAEMTVGDHNGDALGYIDDKLTQWDTNGNIGSLSGGGNQFIYAGTNYRVSEVSFVPDWNLMLFILCPGLDDTVAGQQNLTLNIDPDGLDSFQFNRTIDGASLSCMEYRWGSHGVDPEENGTVSVWLVR